MIPKIKLITILTDNLPNMLAFYKDVLGFTSDDESGDYIELNHDGVCFALCTRKLIHGLTHHEDYLVNPKGQSFELAFWLPQKGDVDDTYDEIVKKGARPILAPHDMPWGQRTAVFADPDGNCHEIYAD